MSSPFKLKTTSLLLMLFMSITFPQPFLKIFSRYKRCEASASPETTTFFNFTSDHLFINDEGDWSSLGVDIKRIYVACDEHNVYMLWVKTATGSHEDNVYFDVGEEGCPIDTINATYMFSTSGFSIYKWNGTDFQLLMQLKNTDLNFWKSDDDRAALKISFVNNEEHCELKMAWSIFDFPQAVKIIDKIKYSGSDQAPDETYVLIYRDQQKRFIVSFYAEASKLEGRPQEIRKRSIGYYSDEGFNVSLKIMNVGDSELEALNISISKPVDLITVPENTLWNISLGINETWNKQFKIIPKRLGWFNLTVTISSNKTAAAFRQILPLNLLVIPKMSVSIQYPRHMRAGVSNNLNITVVNYEKIKAKVAVTTYNWFAECWYFKPLTLELGPNSSVTIVSEITPLGLVSSSFLEMALRYEGLPICSSGSFPFPNGTITIIEPDVQITLNYPKEAFAGEVFYVNISAFNNEDEEIIVKFAVRVTCPSSALLLEDNNYKEQIAFIQPKSTLTLSFKFKAVEENLYACAYAYVECGPLGETDIYTIRISVLNPFTKFQSLILYALLAAFLVAVLGWAFYRRRKHATDFKETK